MRYLPGPLGLYRLATQTRTVDARFDPSAKKATKAVKADLALRTGFAKTAKTGAATRDIGTLSTALIYSDGAKWVDVGRTAVFNGASSAAFTYINGSSSELGAGISATGGSGTWSVAGTTAKSSTSTQSYSPMTSGQTIFQTQFEYGVYLTVGPGYSYYEYRPVSYWGGSRKFATVLSVGSYCAFMENGDSLEKDSTSASTFTAGVAVSGTLGFNLSAKTGYTNSTKLKFTMLKNGYVCGNAGAPGGTPGLLTSRT
ncbi:hypothetical protein [Catellatospora chokoriensis]|uniref:Uncharacterized protein n=1 Tax=Catellatospora chokoriensis TaxID=310353 RepID=A0A8J3NR41_9ACTN|nr:hypothetical protein [Catellatospora chokoriensis]GIF87725.1 hypothetical protein Cch02nite_11690 [Catellatospora chokoriensis]